MSSIVKTNEAGITIKIYDLNTQTLLSEGSVTGVAKLTRSADEKGTNYVNNAETISMQGVIKRYNKYSKTK